MNADAAQQKEVECTPSVTGKVSASWFDTQSIKTGTMNMEGWNILAEMSISNDFMLSNI